MTLDEGHYITFTFCCHNLCAFSGLTLFVRHQEEHLPVKLERWGVDVVICLERGADCLHIRSS